MKKPTTSQLAEYQANIQVKLQIREAISPAYTEAWWAAHAEVGKARNTCPACQSTNTEVRDVDPLWRDGNVVCQDCETFVRYWDPS